MFLGVALVDAFKLSCAATVWERVGKTLEMHAVFKPWPTRPAAARRPAPPGTGSRHRDPYIMHLNIAL